MSEILNLPKGHAILHSSTVEMPLQKARFRIHKIYDSVKDTDYVLCLSVAGKPIDFDKVLKKEQELYALKYGKLHPTLFEKISTKPKPRRVEIMVWVKNSVEEPLKTQFSAKELAADKTPKGIQEVRSRILSETAKYMETISKTTGIKVKRQSKIAPAFIAEATPEQIRSIASYDNVTMVALHEPKGIEDLQDSLNISNAQQVVYTDGNKGANVRVSVWESGPDNISNLVIEDRFNSNPSTSSHARLTTAIIKNKESKKPHGYAPECKMYSANDMDTDALEWAVADKLCSVISQSFHRESEEANGTLSSDDILKDYLAIHYPYPTIAQAAGNITAGETSNEYVNHKGYNSIAVGNHNDSATAMDSGTTWRNPATTHGDRELPELCANGTGVSAVGLGPSTGTSFSAPAVAGSSAVLMGIDGMLKTWPEGVRAILLAGATINVRGSNWLQDLVNNIDARDGSGALNLKESAAIARNKKSPNNAASQRGYGLGTLRSEDFKSNGFANSEYKIKVPKTGPTHVKVALAWNAQVWKFFGMINIGSLPIDLDLKIYKGSTLVAQSSSWDNSYEIAEYDAKPDDLLTIKIKKYSGSDWTYYGIAWTIF